MHVTPHVHMSARMFVWWMVSVTESSRSLAAPRHWRILVARLVSHPLVPSDIWRRDSRVAYAPNPWQERLPQEMTGLGVK